MIPKKYEAIVFSAILSGQMSLLVSGISTLRAIGLAADFVSVWTSAWLTAWLFAFPIVVLVAPLTRRVIRVLVAKG